MKKLDKFLNWLIVYLLGVVLGVFLSGLLMSPALHQPECNEQNKNRFKVCEDKE